MFKQNSPMSFCAADLTKTSFRKILQMISGFWIMTFASRMTRGHLLCQVVEQWGIKMTRFVS